MNRERGTLVVINPYNQEQIDKIKIFEAQLDSGLPVQASQILTRIREQYREEEYQSKKRQDNEIAENLYLEVDQAYVVSCFIEGYKDLSECTLDLVCLKQAQGKGYLATTIHLAYEYAVTQLGMQEVSFQLPKEVAEKENIQEQTGFVPLLQNETSIYFDKPAFLESKMGTHRL